MSYSANSLEVPEDIHVPVRSVWLLQLYASQAYRSGEILDHAIDEYEDELPILVTSMLCEAVEKRFRHELSVGFTLAKDNLNRVRGRIDVLETYRHRLLEKGQISCQYNQLSFDTPVNRYLRHALEHGMKQLAKLPASEASGLVHRCRALVRKFQELGVPSETASRRPKVRLSPQDAKPVNIASLLLEIHIPSSGDGNRGYRRERLSQHQLRALFEKALLGVFSHGLVPRGWSVSGGERIYWDTERAPILPGMQTDIVLRSPSGEVIVVDAKFTDMVTRDRFGGSPTLKSGHMYQLYSYLRSQEHRGEGWEHSRGILLYALSSAEQVFTTDIDGHGVSFVSCQVDQSARSFRRNVLGVVQFGS